MTRSIRLYISGSHACWTRPELKSERYSYDVPTPSALRGILESIHWKPAIRWQVDRIHVLRPIRFQSIRRNEVISKIPPGNVKRAIASGNIDNLYLQSDLDRMQRATTLLVDVAYVIEASVTMTAAAGPNDNLTKHTEIFSRRARKGQCFHQPAMGCREFVADFRLIEDSDPTPAAIDATRDLGLMLWDIDHARDDKPSMFFRAGMVSGIINVPPSGSVEIYQ
jgi:CRISPR-associated protein Cas5d